MRMSFELDPTEPLGEEVVQRVDLSFRDVMQILAALQLWLDRGGFDANFGEYYRYFDDVTPMDPVDVTRLQDRLGSLFTTDQQAAMAN